MPTTLQYFVEIDNVSGHYQGRLSQGDTHYSHHLPALRLAPQDTLDIRGTSYRLDTLSDMLIGHQADTMRTVYDERGQLMIGTYLYGQIFAGLPLQERQRLQDVHVDLRIVTTDEHIARLPWVLLADAGIFLSTAGWSVSLSRLVRNNAYTFPRSPRLLIVAPQPPDVPATQADRHIEALEQLLFGADPLHVRGQHIQVVTTWEDFVQVVPTFRPEAVYYYGHGIGDRHTSRLVFASRRDHSRIDKPIADMALCLRNSLEQLPLIVYLNCCHGDAGGLLGAGQVFGNTIPALVSNRTVAYIDAAQAQGLAFWENVMLQGQQPHLAVSTMTRNLTNLDLSLNDARWMTPVVHCHYSTWHANPPSPLNRFDRDPHWRLKLDRIRQISRVFFRTVEMLQERRPRSLAYIWYGQAGQGVDLFHQRLTVELQEKLPQTFLYEIQPEWHPALDFESMLLDAFRVTSLEAIPGRIRTENRSRSPQTLVYVRHEPVKSNKLINPAVLKDYLEWWDTYLTPLFSGQVFALLGVSFEVGKPDVFHSVLTKTGIPELSLAHTVIEVLDEMSNVEKQDLRNFLRTHNVSLPPSIRDSALENILQRTEGIYEPTLEELQHLVTRTSQRPSTPEPPPAASDNDDYS